MLTLRRLAEGPLALLTSIAYNTSAATIAEVLLALLTRVAHVILALRRLAEVPPTFHTCIAHNISAATISGGAAGVADVY